MDNSPYLTVLNDGINNFLLHSTEETLEIQDPNLKTENIFTEIEDVAKEWSVELPVLMEDQDIEDSSIQLSSANTMGLATNLPNIYENTLANPSNMELDPVSSEENEAQTEIVYPVEVPGKGFITTEGFFITNDLLLQLDFGNTENIGVTNKNSCQTNDEQEIVLPKISNPINNNKSLLICKQVPQKKQINKNLNNTNVSLNNSNLSVSNNSEGKTRDMYKKWFEVVSAYKCKQCDFLTEQQNIMIQHYKLKHLNESIPKNGQLQSTGELKVKSIIRNGISQTIYICSMCNLGFGSTEKLKLHMILIHKLTYVPEVLQTKVHSGVNDDKSSVKPEEMKKMHMSLLRQQSKASKKIKCSVTGCDLRFALDDMRSRHEKCHIEGQKQFKCLECGQKFSMWRLCSLHLWRCHKLDLGLFTCPMCNNFKASSAGRLLTHMAIHEEEKPYKCRVCGKDFKQHSQLINHLIIHKDSNLPKWASKQQCEICQKYFSNSKSLKKHIQSVHDKYKPFICNVCGHKTARKSMLELHLRQHTGEKPHQCSICEYKTGDHNSLRRHLMRHSGRTKYSCPHCQYQSIQSTPYKIHIATKHPGLGGSYFCTLCSYHTVNENIYRAHIGDHEKGLIKEAPKGVGGKNYKNSTYVMENKTNCKDERNVKQETCDIEDDESHNYLSLLEHSNDAVDTGGITIPAGFEIPK